MTQLAVLGHSTRGSEVIALLEMLGGINTHNLYGDESYACYTIDSNNEIKGSICVFGDEQICYFTLEEFLEKFPYKIGDKVSVYEYESKVRINDIKWDGFEIQYSVFTDETEWYSAEELNKCNEPYKEETMERKDYNPITIIPVSSDKAIIIPTDEESEIVQENNKFYLVKKQPQYPKTYEECCGVLGIEEDLWFVYEDIDGKHINPACISNYRIRRLDLYHNFEKLLIHRDAYWKIVGEQMGLGKPWKPDCCVIKQPKFGIHTIDNQIRYITVHVLKNLILVFPTEEMRDTFYENFKDLIEQCKEFL